MSAERTALLHAVIIKRYDGADEAITALTDDGVEELRQMLTHARRSSEEWNDFLDDFVSDPDIVARIKAKSTRKQSGAYKRSGSVSAGATPKRTSQRQGLDDRCSS